MKSYLLILCLAIISLAAHSQQPSLKDLEKILQQAQKQIPAGSYTAADANKTFKVPKRNTTLLAALPKKLFTAAELSAYVKTLLQKFETSPSNQKSIATIKKNYPENAKTDYSRLCILFWYTGHQNDAVYMALKAAAAKPGDLLTLSNLCAFLNISGYPHKSIPMLKYGLSLEPKNILLLNNCGQAYYQLGDMVSASQYLSSCTSIDPYHVEANNTQGHIASAQGNTAAATACYENSIKGGFNQSAAERLQQLMPERRIEDIIEWPELSKYPETDDNIPFECPTIPTDASQFPAHNARIQEESEAWSRTEEDYKTRVNESMTKQGVEMMNTFMSGGRPTVTMGPKHRKAGLAIAKSYETYFEQLKQNEKEFAEWKEDFNKRWAERMKDACLNAASEAACCAIMRGLESEKQAEMASRYSSHCAETWTNVRGFYNCIAYWKPRFINQHGIFDKDLYTARLAILVTAGNLNSMTGIDCSGLCLEAVEPGQKDKNVKFKDPPCTIFKIPLGVGGIEIGCDKFKATAGEVYLGELELNFKTLQTTIAVGVGGQVKTGLANANVGALTYISFDGDFKVTDYGVRVQASAGLAELTGGQLGLNAGSADAAVTLNRDVATGVNSGVNSSININAYNQTLLSKEANLYSFKN